MKPGPLITILQLAALAAHAQGTFYLANKVTERGLDAPILLCDNARTPVSGSNFVAQLYYGADPEVLAPAGDPVPFGEGAAAGYLKGGTNNVVTLPVPAGEEVFLQLRAWERCTGATFEEALANLGVLAESAVWRVKSGGGINPATGEPTPPGALVGLQSFCLVAGFTPLPFVFDDPKHAFPTNLVAVAGQNVSWRALSVLRQVRIQRMAGDGHWVDLKTWTTNGPPLAHHELAFAIPNVQKEHAGQYRLAAVIHQASAVCPEIDFYSPTLSLKVISVPR